MVEHRVHESHHAAAVGALFTKGQGYAFLGGRKHLRLAVEEGMLQRRENRGGCGGGKAASETNSSEGQKEKVGFTSGFHAFLLLGDIILHEHTRQKIGSFFF
jgi:hypothetical protein